MPGKPPYFPFYVNDFAASSKVEAMTTEAVGAYLLLLLKAWHQDPPGSIPADDDVLARWARLAPDRWAAVKPTVLAAFASGSDGRYHQLRMRDEYRKLMALFQARSRAGKKTAAKRWSKKKSGPRSLATSSATAELVAPDSESESDSGSESPGKRGEAGGEGFAEFWAAYPRKTAKVKARQAWDRLSPGGELLAVMLAAVERQRRSDQWTRDGGAYIPHASTWLNGRRWEDEPPPPPAPQARDGRHRAPDFCAGPGEWLNRRTQSNGEP